jgi:hypothetical protein
MNEIGLVETVGNIDRKIRKRLAPLARAEGLSLVDMAELLKTNHLGARREIVLADHIGLPASIFRGMLDPYDHAMVIKGTEKLGELVRSLLRDISQSLEKTLHELPQNIREWLICDLVTCLECLEQEERAK